MGGTRPMVHLHTPAARNAAVCGDANAKHFATWRWQCTCTMCKTITAPRPMPDAREERLQYRADLPVRYSNLVAQLRNQDLPNVDEALMEFEHERRVAAICNKCGPLPDPIALMDVPNNRMVFICPNCTTNENLRTRWTTGG